MTDDERRELKDAIMEADLKVKHIQHDLYTTQYRWEAWKALAAMVAAGAVFFGGVIAVSNWVRPAAQPTISAPFVFPPGTVITIPPASK